MENRDQTTTGPAVIAHPDVQDEYVRWISLLLEHGRYEPAQVIAREQLIRTARYVEALNATFREAAAIAEHDADMNDNNTTGVEWLKAS